jgi:hypothetical protein
VRKYQKGGFQSAAVSLKINGLAKQPEAILQESSANSRQCLAREGAMKIAGQTAGQPLFFRGRGKFIVCKNKKYTLAKIRERQPNAPT